VARADAPGPAYDGAVPRPSRSVPRPSDRATARAGRRPPWTIFAIAGLVVAIVAVLLVGGGGDGATPVAADRSPTPVPTTTATAPTPVRAPLRELRIEPMRPGTAKVVQRGPTKGRKIAFTFDDGYCKACVADLVGTLRRTGMPATLFPNGQYASSWEPQAARIRRMIREGQVTVGSHTWSHPDMRTLSDAALAADVDRNERWIQKTFHVSGRPWLRPPFGAYHEGTLRVLGSRGYTRVIMWSGTVADSSPRTTDYLVDAVRHWAKPGVIMLLHANYPNTAKAIPRMLEALRNRDLTPVTIDDLLGGSQG